MSVFSDIDIRKELGKNIVIHPLLDECISPLGYDLRIGVVSILDYPKYSPIKEGKIVLPPMHSIQILTKERIWLSNKVIGTLHSRGSFSARGLILNSTTVDPNWKGQMTFLMYNSSRNNIEIEIDSRFMTLIFHYVKTETKSAPKTNPIVVAQNHKFPEAIVRDVTLNNEFYDKIKDATTPSILGLIHNLIDITITKFLKFLKRDFTQLIIIILLIVDIVSLILFSLGFFEFFKSLFNIEGGGYDKEILMFQLGVIVTLIIGIRQGKR